MDIKKHIPNTITCCNLLSGCVSCVMAMEGNFIWALAFIVFGAIFDFFDGMVARLLKVSSPLGVQLDSLADDVTFGFAPSFMVFVFMRGLEFPDYLAPVAGLLPFVAFFVAAFSAMRLAIFNIDKRQATTFIGLPTPANALFWGALVLGSHDAIVACAYGWAVVLLLVGLFSWLLVAEIPMFSLKFKNLAWKSNRTAYIFLIVSGVLLGLLGLNGLSAVIGWYIVLSILTYRKA